MNIRLPVTISGNIMYGRKGNLFSKDLIEGDIKIAIQIISSIFVAKEEMNELRGLFDMYCVLYDISKAFESNSQMDITSLQSVLRDLKYTISISESISEMRHGTLI